MSVHAWQRRRAVASAPEQRWEQASGNEATRRAMKQDEHGDKKQGEA